MDGLTQTEQETLIVLLLFVRSTIDLKLSMLRSDIVNHDKFQDLNDLLAKAPSIEEGAVEFCLGTLRQDRGCDIMAEVDKILNTIRRILARTVGEVKNG